MREALDYVTEYERVDPERVTPGLENLRKEPDRALILLAQVECE